MVVTLRLPWWIFISYTKARIFWKDFLHIDTLQFVFYQFMPEFKWLLTLFYIFSSRTINNFLYSYLRFFQFQWPTIQSLLLITSHRNLSLQYGFQFIICNWLSTSIHVNAFYSEQFTRCNETFKKCSKKKYWFTYE